MSHKPHVAIDGEIGWFTCTGIHGKKTIKVISPVRFMSKTSWSESLNRPFKFLRLTYAISPSFIIAPTWPPTKHENCLFRQMLVVLHRVSILS